MACHARNDLSPRTGINNLYDTLWELHRCDGSSVICRWKLVDEKFLNHFVAQFEKVKKRIAISEEEVLEAIASIKKATTNARRGLHETKPSLSASGTQPSGMWNIKNSRD